MKNKWKIAFWICFSILVATVLFAFYSILDQGVTITYMKEGYTDTEADLESMIDIIETENMTKNQIKKVLSSHRLFEFMDFKSDTIALERTLLIFKNDTLKKVEKQW